MLQLALYFSKFIIPSLTVMCMDRSMEGLSVEDVVTDDLINNCDLHR